MSGFIQNFKENFGEKFVEFLKEHAILLFTIFVFLVLFLIGQGFRGSALKEYRNIEAQIVSVKNQIEQDKITVNQETNYVSRGLVGGLDKNRWASDDVIISEWIYPAFNFSSAQEYNEHRDLFVTRLGQSDDFVQQIMPPFVQGITGVADETSSLDDGSDINMSLTSFKSYVDSVEGDTYSYVAIVKCSSTNARGFAGLSDVILTYSITGDGTVTDFHGATPYLDYTYGI